MKLKFGIHKGKLIEDIPIDYLKFLMSKNILKGKLLHFTQKKLNLPKTKYIVTVEDSVNQDGEYQVETYNSKEAIYICQKQYKIQSTQSYHGTSYSVKLIS